jgi:hypothetical protein
MEVIAMTKYIKTAVLVICIIVLFSPLTWASDEKAAEEVTRSGVYDETFSEAPEQSARATIRPIGDAAAKEDTYGEVSKLTKIFQLKHAQVSSLEKVISDLCSTDGKAVVDERTNSVVVTDVPAALDYIEQAISRLDTGTPDMLKLAEDLEVMSRIIDKTLTGSFPDHYKVARTFTSIGSHQGCQGIYLKGYGAVFMTSIGFPVSERKTAEGKTAPDDLWQRTRYEIIGVPGAMSLISRGDSGKYEPEKVEQLKEELLKLIGTYAHNIRQLGANENIVVAVRGAGDYPHSVSLRTMFSDHVLIEPGQSSVTLFAKVPEAVPTTGAPKAEVWVKKKEGKPEAKSELEKPELEKPELEKPEALPKAPRTESPPITIPTPSTVTAPSTGMAVPKPSVPAIGSVPIIGTVAPEPGVGGRTTLIIKVRQSDAEDYKMGRFDLDELGDRTEVIQY